MTRMRHVNCFVATIALVASSVSCGDVVRSGRSPMFLVVGSLLGASGGGSSTFGSPVFSDVLSFVTSPAPCTTDNPCPTYYADLGQVTLRLERKNITVAPSTNNDVTINRYRVVYKRADGRNTPGVDVPYAFDGAATGTVPAGGSLTLGFELVRHVAKQEAPLAGLAFSPSIITTIADVTFYGRDLVGNEISVTGSIQIDFGNFGG